MGSETQGVIEPEGLFNRGVDAEQTIEAGAETEDVAVS
jgi:hypothetical protein